MWMFDKSSPAVQNDRYFIFNYDQNYNDIHVTYIRFNKTTNTTTLLTLKPSKLQLVQLPSKAKSQAIHHLLVITNIK